jgi:hypothetical protein
MIQGGGWNRLRTSDEHTKLARISVDFISSADSLFELNVSKTQVRVPTSLRAELGTIASSVARMAQDIYRGHSDGSHASDLMSARTQAVRELVGMVLSTVRTTLAEEVDPTSPQGIKVSRRLQDLEQRLVDDLAMIAAHTTVKSGDLRDSKGGSSRVGYVRGWRPKAISSRNV